MTLYRKKPVVIEAVQFDGDNHDEVREFIAGAFPLRGLNAPRLLWIRTLEGTMQANSGDYIIRGVQGEFYPCKSDIFEATYERVADDERTDSVSEVRGDEAP